MMDLSPKRLREFFNPRSIAFVGASDRNDHSVQVLKNLEMHSFAGSTYFVNPARDRVHGQRTAASLSAIGEPVDLAFVFIGGDRVIDIALEAASLGIRNLVVLASGFGEAGGEGVARERRLVQVAQTNDQVILGPNTIGFVNLSGNVVLYGVRNKRRIPRGNVGLAVQSGGMLAMSFSGLSPRGVGTSLAAAVNNESVLATHHMVDYFVDDPDTAVIGLFVEGTRDSLAFRESALRALEAGKPIVALTGARTSVTANTALTHTGVLVGDGAVNHAALAELGVITVNCLEDFFSTIALISHRGPIAGRRIAFTSPSGGQCELFSDRAVELGLTMPSFSAESEAALKEILPWFGVPKNPLDYTGVGQTDRELFPSVLKVIAGDPNIDIVVFGDDIPPTPRDDTGSFESLITRVGSIQKAAGKPVLACGVTFRDPPAYVLELEARTGMGPEIGGVEHGPRAIERSVWWSEARLRVAREGVAPTIEELRSARPDLARAQVGVAWTEERVLDLLGDAGVSIAPHRVCKTVEEVCATAEEFGFPTVLKISSPDIRHKGRAGGVILNLRDREAVAKAFDQVRTASLEAYPEALLDGVLVMPQLEGGFEMIVGVKRDDTWGLVLAFGLGGVWAEAFGNPVICLLPTTAAHIRAQLGASRFSALLQGGHGLTVVDVDRLSQQILNIANLAIILGDQVDGLEVNPLLVNGTTICALDGLIANQSGRLQSDISEALHHV